MRGKAVWPSTTSFLAPAEVAASLALVVLVAGFAGFLLLHASAARGPASDPPRNSGNNAVVTSPSPSPSPSPEPTAAAQQAAPVLQPVNPATGGNRAAAVATATSRPRVRPTSTPSVLPSPLGTPPIYPSPLASPTPTP